MNFSIRTPCRASVRRILPTSWLGSCYRTDRVLPKPDISCATDNHPLGPRQSAQVAVYDDAVEAVVDEDQQVAEQLGEQVLDIRFLRDVGAENARKAWRDGFDGNCKLPCHLDPSDVQRFLAAVPSMHEGDKSTLLFTSRGVRVTFNGRPIGDIADPHFAQTVLATFIGPEPPTRRLKRELLGGRD